MIKLFDFEGAYVAECGKTTFLMRIENSFMLFNTKKDRKSVSPPRKKFRFLWAINELKPLHRNFRKKFGWLARVHVCTWGYSAQWYSAYTACICTVCKYGTTANFFQPPGKLELSSLLMNFSWEDQEKSDSEVFLLLECAVPTRCWAKSSLCDRGVRYSVTSVFKLEHFFQYGARSYNRV
jgi:hypothetical protein